MAGLSVKLGNIQGEIDRIAAAYMQFGKRKFARAVQFNLNRIAVDGVNLFRFEVPRFLDNPVPWMADGVRYELDKKRLASVETIDQAKASVFIQDQQSSVWKYAFGDGVTARFGGDVGIEGWLNDSSKTYIPQEGNLRATQGMRPDAHGNFKGADIRRIAAGARGGYKSNFGNGNWPTFTIKAGASGHLRPGIYARPQRKVVAGQRKPSKADVFMPDFLGGAGLPKTVEDSGDYRKIHRMDGTHFHVPQVKNLDRPRLLFLERDEVEHEPVAAQPWERAMAAAAAKFGGWMEEELADSFEHAAKKAGR